MNLGGTARHRDFLYPSNIGGGGGRGTGGDLLPDPIATAGIGITEVLGRSRRFVLPLRQAALRIISQRLSRRGGTRTGLRRGGSATGHVPDRIVGGRVSVGGCNGMDMGRITIGIPRTLRSGGQSPLRIIGISLLIFGRCQGA